MKTLEDLAGCAVDDLLGYTERRDGQDVREPGFFDGLEVSGPEAEGVVMAARRKIGWVEDEPAPAEDGGEPGEE